MARAPATLVCSVGDLCRAVEFLTIERPGHSVPLQVSIEGRQRRIIAWWLFPGRVDATFPGPCGPLIAQSVPGHPTVLSDYDYGEPFEGDPRDLRIAAELTREERQAVLIAAASELRRHCRPIHDRRAHVGIGCDWVSVDVRWEWPGVFAVTERKSGRVIGRTAPGKPNEFLQLDAEGAPA